MDVFDKEKRSQIMSKIRSNKTKPEMDVRKFLFSKGFRYRMNDARYPGSPDIVLPKHRTVIFINGCFWHGHEGCKLAKLPTTNIKFWRDKILKNKERDKKNCFNLMKENWYVITIWQCELKNLKVRQNRLHNLINEILNH